MAEPDPILFMITTAGLNALVDAQGGTTEPIKIVSMGLTESAFLMAPTITSVPNERKRIEAVSGEAVNDTVIHMTAQDASTDVYELRGLGLYLEDGTLFAVYSQSNPLFRKVDIAFFLMALDIAFSNGVAGDITFGATSFLLPPATETVKGVAEIATPEEAATGSDHSRIITPRTLKQLLDALGLQIDADMDALASGFDALLAALIARTITGGGLVSGGGDLSASRILSVLAATSADVAAGTASDRAITPAALSGLSKYLGMPGHALLPGCGGLMLQWGRLTAIANASTATLFPLAFPVACLGVVASGGVSGGADSQDNPPVLVESTISQTGFSVFSADDSAAGMRFLAWGV